MSYLHLQFCVKGCALHWVSMKRKEEKKEKKMHIPARNINYTFNHFLREGERETGQRNHTNQMLTKHVFLN